LSCRLVALAVREAQAAQAVQRVASV